MKKNNLSLVLVLLVGLSLACSFLDGDLDAANKLVEEANTIIQKNNEVSGKATDLYNELMTDNLSKAKDVEAYKLENKSKFDELVNLLEQRDKLGIESAAKFEQASKLNVSKEAKEYFSLLSEESKKDYDTRNLMTIFIKEFLQTKDVDKINKQLADFEKKREASEKEAEESSKKLEQFKKDNPTILTK